MAETQRPLHLWQGREELAAVLVQHLSTRHAGRKHGIRAEDLAGLLGVAERMLRELITRAREDGVAIVGTPETGYYVAQTGEELEECCKFLRARALHSLTIEARLRKVALPELLGQLKVGT